MSGTAEHIRRRAADYLGRPVAHTELTLRTFEDVLNKVERDVADAEAYRDLVEQGVVSRG